MLLEHPFQVDSRVLKEARSLAQAGYDVTVIALSRRGLPRNEYRDGFRIYRPRRLFSRLRHKALLPLSALEFFVVTLFSAVCLKANIYHCHSPFTLLQATLAAMVRRKPLIYDSHELSAAHSSTRTFKSSMIRAIERLSLCRVDLVIMSDGKSRADAFRDIHKFTGPIEYVYNCAGLATLPTTGYNLRDRLALPEDVRIVLYIGLVGHGRGLEPAVKAIAAYGSGGHFIMMGPMNLSFRIRLEEISQRYGVNNRVHFVDAVPTDEVPLWASSVDITLTLIQPRSLSYRCSAPTKMFEALMARVPQVASDFPEIRRVLVDNGIGPAGVLVDPEDQEAITTAVRKLLDDADLRAELSKNAGVLSRETYNWENQEKALLTIYAELMSSLK